MKVKLILSVLLMLTALRALATITATRISDGVYCITVPYDEMSKIGDYHEKWGTGYLYIEKDGGDPIKLFRFESFLASNNYKAELNQKYDMHNGLVCAYQNYTKTSNGWSFLGTNEIKFSKNRDYQWLVFLPTDFWGHQFSLSTDDSSIVCLVSNGKMQVKGTMCSNENVTVEKKNNSTVDITFPIMDSFAYDRIVKEDKNSRYLMNEVAMFAYTDEDQELELFRVNEGGNTAAIGQGDNKKAFYTVKATGMDGSYLINNGKYYAADGSLTDIEKESITSSGVSFNQEILSTKKEDGICYATVRVRLPETLRTNKPVYFRPYIKTYVSFFDDDPRTQTKYTQPIKTTKEALTRPEMFSNANEMLDPSIVSAILDTNVKDASATGRVILHYMYAGNPEKVELMNADNQILYTVTDSAEIVSRLIRLDYSDQARDVRLRITMKKEKNQVTQDVCFTPTYSVQPFHRMYTDEAKDSVNIFDHSSIYWSIKHPEADDMFNDGFIVSRSYDASFNNSVSLTTFSLDEGKKMPDDIAQYEFLDTNPWESYNLSSLPTPTASNWGVNARWLLDTEEYKSIIEKGDDAQVAKNKGQAYEQASIDEVHAFNHVLENHFNWTPRQVYYQVYRPTGIGSFGTEKGTHYYKNYERVMSQQLPEVDTLRVDTLNAEWKTSRNAMVRVVMRNKTFNDYLHDPKILSELNIQNGEVIAGEGTDLSQQGPISMHYSSINEQTNQILYTKNDLSGIPVNAWISKLTFYINSDSDIDKIAQGCGVYLSSTEDATLSNTEPQPYGSKYYWGVFSVNHQDNSIEITLKQPYKYDGRDLVVTTDISEKKLADNYTWVGSTQVNNRINVKTVSSNYVYDFLPKCKFSYSTSFLNGLKNDQRLNVWDENASVTIRVAKLLSYEGMTEPAETQYEDFSIKGSEIKYDAENNQWYAERQIHLADPFTNHSFYAAVDPGTSIYPYTGPTKTEEMAYGDKNIYFTDEVGIYDLTASYEESNEHIRVQWKRNGGDFKKYELHRREYKASRYDATSADYDPNWTKEKGIQCKIDTSIDPEQSFFVDDTLYTESNKNGLDAEKLYEYRVTYVRNFHGREMTSYAVTPKPGKLSPYIALSGTIMARSSNGKEVAIPDLPLKLMSVDGKTESETNKKYIAKLNSNFKTDEQGNYRIVLADSIMIGTYNLVINSDKYEASDFTDINGNYGKSEVDFYGAPTKTSYNFYNRTSANLSGRVLYEGSTIPVQNAYFVMYAKDANGNVTETPVTNGAGQRVLTNATGNYDFILPAGTYQLRVKRDGHEFKDGGFLKGTSTNTTSDSDGNPIITLENNQEVAGQRLWDSTKILVKGRIQAGHQDDDLTIGEGHTKNRIGDNLKMVLMLEGDNISHIVSDLEDENKIQCDSTFTHAVQEFSTKVNYELKHITIKPDSATGEFYVKLFPVKYKITEISAQGYSTLMAEGESVKVLDLSTVAKDTTFLHHYISPLTVSYKQHNFGMDQELFGMESITVEQLDGSKKTIDVAKMENGVAKYAFGNPVYQSDTHVFFRNYMKVSADHYYYYNNDTLTNHPYKEPVNAGKLKVYNGLCDEGTIYEAPITGETIFAFDVNNSTFTLTGENALRQMNIYVEESGKTFTTREPFKAYIMGEHKTGTNIGTATGDISLLDVIYDPQGSKSYAWIAEGKHYTYSRTWKFNFDVGMTLNFASGIRSGYYMGTFAGAMPGGGTNVGTTSSADTKWSWSMDIPIFGVNSTKSANMDVTFNTKLQTSAEPTPEGIGANADLYVGTMQQVGFSTVNRIALIDSLRHAQMKPAIDNGTIRIIQSAKDKSGKELYLAVIKDVMAEPKALTTFAYSQHYILNNILPDLYARLAQLVVCVKNEQEAQAIADAKHTNVYYIESGTEFNENTDFKIASPSQSDGSIDQVKSIVDQIKQWTGFIEETEHKKLVAMNSDAGKKTYSVAGSMNMEYKESAEFKTVPTSFKLWLTGAVGRIVHNDGSSVSEVLLKEGFDIGTSAAKSLIKLLGKNHPGNGDKDSTNVKAFNTEIDVPGFSSRFNILPIVDLGLTDNATPGNENNVETGFVLNAGNDQSSLSIDAVSIGLNDYFTGLKKVYGSIDEDLQKTIDFINDNPDLQMKDLPLKNAKLTNKMFFTRGGLTRAPYNQMDTTLFFRPGTPLGSATLKVDNPKLTLLTEAQVNNLPADDDAVFEFLLSNESELEENVKTMTPTTFILRQDFDSNANGAEISIDGEALGGNNFSYCLEPGQSIKKTMKVKRGKGYNFDDLRLLFYPEDDCWNYATAKFAVHFRPESSPVKLSAPKNNWVLNTYSPRDEVDSMYYMPVEITGFNVKQNNFDHIELQYKPTLGSDADWVNICSFFEDPKLYALASGKKELINGRNTLQARFFGERDPMEMKYDLRAVTYCRYGNEYVTAKSEVLSGTKDTRRPQIYGKIEPANGILTYATDNKIQFSEPIAYNYLDEDNNFRIFGFTNVTTVGDGTAVEFPEPNQGDKVSALSEVSRNMSGRNFSIGMLVRPSSSRKQWFFSHGTDKEALLALGMNEKGQLVLEIKTSNTADAASCTTAVTDQPVSETDLPKAYHHFVVTYEQYNDNGTPKTNKGSDLVTASFYWDGKLMPAKVKNDKGKETPLPVYPGNGLISLGNNIGTPNTDVFAGRMKEVKLWGYVVPASIAMSSAEKAISLQGYSNHLIARYPMDEATGSVLKDEVGGNNIIIDGLSWFINNGYSLRFNANAKKAPESSKPLTIVGDTVSHVKEHFNFTADNDYTLTFWYLIDKRVEGDNGYEQGKLKPYNFFYAGNNSKEMYMQVDEATYKMSIVQTGKDPVSVSLPADENWHHLALSVNHAENVAQLFIDNKIVYRGEAEDFIGIPADGTSQNVIFGHENFKGNIDNVTLWSAALPAVYLNEIWNKITEGDEPNLVVSLPFEEYFKTDQNLYDVTPSVDNELAEFYVGSKKTTYEKAFDIEISEDGNSDQRLVKQQATVGRVPAKDNVKFSWSSTGNNLLIDINSMPSKINHNNLYISLRDVEDLYGNRMASPKMWSVYLDLNRVKWDNTAESMTVNYNESADLDLGFSNLSGTAQYYTIFSDAAWLRFDGEKTLSSRIQPDDKKTVKVSIPNTLSPGDYEEKIYIETTDSLTSIFTLKLKVKGVAPDFEVDKSRFKSNMNLRGSVKLMDAHGVQYLDEDKEDIVFALHSNNVVGKTNIDFKDGSESNVYMTLYGDNDVSSAAKSEEIRFFLWHAKSGNLYRLNALDNQGKDLKILFKEDAVYGMKPTSETPVEFRCSTTMIQTIDLQKGFNWISTYLKAQGTTLTESFLSNSQFVDGDYVKTSDKVSAYIASTKRWSDDDNKTGIGPLDNRHVYRFYSNNGGKIYRIGNVLNEDEVVVTLKHGWNDLPYLLNSTLSLSTALNDYTPEPAKAQDGDIVKSLDQFAVLNGNQWVGTLEALRPGQGYLLRRTDKSEVKIKYPYYEQEVLTQNAQMTRAMAPETRAAETEMTQARILAGLTGSHMIIMATLTDEDAMDGKTLLALADGVVVGEAETTVLPNGKKVFLLSAFADPSATLSFAVAEGDEIQMAKNRLAFDELTPKGSIEKPYEISLMDDDGRYGSRFNVAGVRVGNSYRGIVINKGKKSVNAK